MRARIKSEYKEIFFRDQIFENKGQYFTLSAKEKNDYRFTTKTEEEEENEEFHFDEVEDDEVEASETLEAKFDQNPESLTKKELEALTESLGLEVDSRKSKAKMIEDIQNHEGK